MNLRSIDLNLLIALDALLIELHVSRAADRIGLSQPAMSNALARLRHILKDDLLVRTASGMQATPRARELAEPVRQTLHQMERLFESDASFTPSDSNRTFVIRLSDLLQLLFLPSLLGKVAHEAPKVSFDVTHLSPARTVEALERDEIDLAVSMGLDHSSAIRSEMLLPDRMVCVMRKGHPLANKAMTLDNFLRLRHLKISLSPTDMRFADDVLKHMRLARDVAINVPTWLVAMHVLAQTDYITVMPARLSAALGGKAIVARDLPFASPPFHWALYWHRRYEKSPANRWLRDQIADVAHTLS